MKVLRRGRLLGCLVACAVVGALALDGSEATPHHGMASGSGVSPGLDAAHPSEPAAMAVPECGGELGAIPKVVHEWPTLGPLPSDFAPQPGCQDDGAFRDLMGMTCADYNANTELCTVAMNYANEFGQAARHACCKCGGGDHITSTITTKCYRPPMGGDAREGEDRFETMGGLDVVLGRKPAPVTRLSPEDEEATQRMAGDGEFDEVFNDDEFEKAGVDQYATVKAMNNVLQPDEVVFRSRNFVGAPSEPESDIPEQERQYGVRGIIRLHHEFSEDFEGKYGAVFIASLAKCADLDLRQVSLVSVKPGSIVVEFFVTMHNDSAVAGDIASRLNSSLSSGEFMRYFSSSSSLDCDMNVVLAPQVELAKTRMDSVIGGEEQAPTHVQYTTIPYTVTGRETVASIANKFHVDPSLIVGFNQDVADPSLIKAGDEILIPMPRTAMIASVDPLESAVEGGEEVTIHGYGFVSPAYCKFGDLLTMATFVVDDTIVCLAPEQQDPGLYSIAVSDGNGGFIDSDAAFRYTAGLLPFCGEHEEVSSHCRPRVSIATVEPLRVPQDTKAVVTITGTGFNISTVCYLAGEPRPTQVHSRTRVTCELPPTLPSSVTVGVVQGDVSMDSPNEIVVYSTLSVTKLEPSFGPEKGGNTVIVRGTTFKPGCVCRFDEIVVPATFFNSTTIACDAPASEARVVRVDVSNDGVLFTSVSPLYEYTYLELHGISKTSGPVAGGNVVLLTGYGFYPDMWCRFGASVTHATFLNFTLVRCTVPPKPTAGSVPVAVSLELERWTDEDVSYTYNGAVTRISPVEGSSSGGTQVVVEGEGFDKHCAFVCRFGARVVPAIVVNPTTLHCLSPPGSGTVEFAVESKDLFSRDPMATQALTFTFQGGVLAGAAGSGGFAVVPDHVNVRSPNTTVTIHGTGFVRGTLCRFGDKVAMSAFVDEGTIKCDAPMRDLAEVVDVFTSPDGGRTWSAPVAQLEYRAVVEYVESPQGLLEGGNEVYVKGFGFNYRISLCVFGGKVIPAKVESQYVVRCVAPPSVRPGRVGFAVTCNESALYDEALRFSFGDPRGPEWDMFYLYVREMGLRVVSMEPASGTSFGGTEVALGGQGFTRTSHCLFGTNAVKAVFVDASRIRCTAPTHPAGVVDVSVTIFDAASGYTTQPVENGRGRFAYTAPAITSVSPSRSNVTAGMEAVVRGVHLLGAQHCLFGRRKSEAHFVTDDEVRCTVPSAEISGVVAVEVEFTGSGATHGDVRFTYLPIVSDMAPNNGFVRADSHKVVFSGQGFNGESTACVFQEKPSSGLGGAGAEAGEVARVQAVVRSTQEIECPVPIALRPHVAVVSLSTTLELLGAGGAKFDFKYHFVVDTISPHTGPTTGTTPIVLTGLGLRTATHCAFGDVEVPAMVESDKLVRCTSPNHAPGKVKVKVVSKVPDVDEQFVSNPVEYAYEAMATRVDRIHPTSGSLGGGTPITVRGDGFTMGSFCRFGDAEVPVTYFAPDHVLCYAPSVDSPRTVALEVNKAGGHDAYSTDGRMFRFVAGVATVSRLEPNWAEVGATIEVHGSGFDSSSRCYFGGRASRTEFVSDAMLRCEVPQMAARTQEIVEVASDANSLPGGHVTFHYALGLSSADSPAVREIVPNHGPSSGGSAVQVSGVGFPERALCRFGDLFVPALVLSPTLLECAAPQHRAATVALEVVSKDRTLFSSSFKQYTFEASPETAERDLFDASSPGEPSLDRIAPTMGPSGTTIVLTGQRFPSVGMCVFSDVYGSVQSRATVRDSTTALCDVPLLDRTRGPDLLVRFVSAGGDASHTLGFRFISQLNVL